MSLLDGVEPDYGTVSQEQAPLLTARKQRESISESLSVDDRSVLSFHHVSYTIRERKFGVISVGQKHILNDLR